MRLISEPEKVERALSFSTFSGSERGRRKSKMDSVEKKGREGTTEGEEC